MLLKEQIVPEQDAALRSFCPELQIEIWMQFVHVSLLLENLHIALTNNLAGFLFFKGPVC